LMICWMKVSMCLTLLRCRQPRALDL